MMAVDRRAKSTGFGSAANYPPTTPLLQDELSSHEWQDGFAAKL